MGYDDDNVFAKILRDEMPSHRVYEDEQTLAFMDIMPVAKGHTLVIAKTKGENIFDLDEESLSMIKNKTEELSFLVRVKQVNFTETCKKYKDDDIDGQKIRISVE